VILKQHEAGVKTADLCREHGISEATLYSLRADNGPEFCSRRMLGWAEERKIALVDIQPGRPMQNGHVESFHGRLRDECLTRTGSAL